jgi:hypothetical protein
MMSSRTDREVRELLADALRIRRPSKLSTLSALPLLLRDADAGAAVTVAAHLMPRRPRAPADPFEWVRMACSRVSMLGPLQWIRARDGRMMATDRHRIHSAPTPWTGFLNGMAKGQPATVSLPEDGWTTPCGGRFPDMAAVIPERDPAAPVLTWGEWEDVAVQGGDLLVQVSGAWVSWEYMAEAMAGADWAHLSASTATAPMRLDMPGDRVAVIMPRWGPT